MIPSLLFISTHYKNKLEHYWFHLFVNKISADFRVYFIFKFISFNYQTNVAMFTSNDKKAIEPVQNNVYSVYILNKKYGRYTVVSI